MKRESRPLEYENDPQALTRPDIVPAALRELAPYRELRPHSDEQTVKYALVQGVSTVSAPPASGVQEKVAPRNEAVATPLPKRVERFSTPLPKRVERFSTPLPKRVERFSTPSVSFVPPPKPVAEWPAAPARAAPQRQGPSLLGVALLVLTTSGVAAAVGAGFGSGRAQALLARWFGAAASPVVVAPVRSGASAPVRPGVPAVVAPAQPPAAPPADSSAPALSFRDLPLTDQPAAAPAAPLRKRPRAPRRH